MVGAKRQRDVTAKGSDKNYRYEMAQTPEERLAAIARQLVVRMVDPAPNVPDFADFAEELRPYVQREILMARMAEAARFGTYVHVQDLQKDIEQLETEIEARGKKAKR